MKDWQFRYIPQPLFGLVDIKLNKNYFSFQCGEEQKLSISYQYGEEHGSTRKRGCDNLRTRTHENVGLASDAKLYDMKTNFKIRKRK